MKIQQIECGPDIVRVTSRRLLAVVYSVATDDVVLPSWTRSSTWVRAWDR